MIHLFRQYLPSKITDPSKDLSSKETASTTCTKPDHGKEKNISVSKSISWLSWWTSTDLDYLIYLCGIAIAVRLFILWHPSVVIFDEVHFGGFASQYLNHNYYLDVHPPLAKLLVALTGWFGGLEKNFKFSAIGVDYLEFQAPFFFMRLVPAILGAAMVPLAYISCRGLGLPSLASLWTSLLVLFENSFVTQFRFILLDAYLAFGTACSVAAWACFRNRQDHPFSIQWWTYLSLLGISLGFTVSCKWVGLFNFATIGVVTLIDLWNLFGNRSISLKRWFSHFVARALCLILIPLLIYMGSFYIHFKILSDAGVAGQQMSIEFQQDLDGLFIPKVPEDVGYGSIISLRHYASKNGYLHSHHHLYPAGSKQQQITLYSARQDPNNYWKIVPARQVNEQINDTSVIDHPIANTTFVPLRHNDVIRLIHIGTGRFLHSHAIEPPLSSKEHYFEVSAYGTTYYNLGDGNDNWIVQLTDVNGFPLNEKYLVDDDPEAVASNTLLFTTVTRTLTEYEEETTSSILAASQASSESSSSGSSSSSPSSESEGVVEKKEIVQENADENKLKVDGADPSNLGENNISPDKLKEDDKQSVNDNGSEVKEEPKEAPQQPEKKIKKISEIIEKSDGRKVLKPIKARTSYLRLVHANTGCYLTSAVRKLPEWGFGQFETLCGRDSVKKSSVWVIEHNENPLLEDPVKVEYRELSFWEKFMELNIMMWNLNAALIADHHFASRPQDWLTLRRGVGFWNGYAQGKTKNISVMTDQQYKEFLKEQAAQDKKVQHLQPNGDVVNNLNAGINSVNGSNTSNLAVDKMNASSVQLIHTVWHNGQFIDNPDVKSRHKSQQIYLIGNPIIWWCVTGFLFIYLVILVGVAVREHRKNYDLSSDSILRLTSSAGFLFIGWALHYFPFYLMKRQLFLHHYLPAYFYGILLFGLMMSRFVDWIPFSQRTLNWSSIPTITISKRQIVGLLFTMTIAACVSVFILFSPLSYGLSMSKEQCLRLRWLSSWDFDCNALLSSVSPSSTSF